MGAESVTLQKESKIKKIHLIPPVEKEPIITLQDRIVTVLQDDKFIFSPEFNVPDTLYHPIEATIDMKVKVLNEIAAGKINKRHYERLLRQIPTPYDEEENKYEDIKSPPKGILDSIEQNSKKEAMEDLLFRLFYESEFVDNPRMTESDAFKNAMENENVSRGFFKTEREQALHLLGKFLLRDGNNAYLYEQLVNKLRNLDIRETPAMFREKEKTDAVKDELGRILYGEQWNWWNAIKTIDDYARGEQMQHSNSVDSRTEIIISSPEPELIAA